MIGEVATYLRIGKELVLPRKKEMYTEDIHDALGKVLETKECFKMVPLYERPPDEESEPTTYDYRARVCRDERFGRLGKVRVLRYHPLTSSTNPAIQVCMRCNVDVSCMDRLPVLPSGWEHLDPMDHQSGYDPDGTGTRVAAPCVGGGTTNDLSNAEIDFEIQDDFDDDDYMQDTADLEMEDNDDHMQESTAHEIALDRANKEHEDNEVALANQKAEEASKAQQWDDELLQEAQFNEEKFSNSHTGDVEEIKKVEKFVEYLERRLVKQLTSFSAGRKRQEQDKEENDVEGKEEAEGEDNAATKKHKDEIAALAAFCVSHQLTTLAEFQGRTGTFASDPEFTDHLSEDMLELLDSFAASSDVTYLQLVQQCFERLFRDAEDLPHFIKIQIYVNCRFCFGLSLPSLFQYYKENTNAFTSI